MTDIPEDIMLNAGRHLDGIQDRTWDKIQIAIAKAIMDERERCTEIIRYAWGSNVSLDALERATKDQWQAIETAPTDGTDFIGWNGKRPFLCRMTQHYVKWPHEEGGPTFKGMWSGDYYDSISPEKPTHWQPLPSLPEVSA